MNLMKPGRYTLPENEFDKIHRLEPLDPDLHNFRSSNYDEYETDGLDLSRLVPHYQKAFHSDQPEYILWFADGTPLGWYDHNSLNWVVAKLTSGLSSPSLYRITTYIRGLHDGAVQAMIS